MIQVSRPRWMLIAFIGYGLFALSTSALNSTRDGASEVPGSVVLPSWLQLPLYFGDRYLAANVEAARVLGSGGAAQKVPQDYLDRLHLAITALNPCHEDNYYVANALSAWAGSVDAALAILGAATRCRYWDEVPPFFLGFNVYFFKRENLRARDWLFEAAERATENAAGFRKIGLMMEAESLPDARAAQQFLQSQFDQALDAKLRAMLEPRIRRLAGLVTLQDAQLRYEKEFGRRLSDPEDLLRARILDRFPRDPLGLGYEFSNGKFVMKELRIRGASGGRQ